jgi:hypothetical protein
MALIMVALAWPASALPSRDDPSRLLDSMRADYLEDELTGRRIADFRMQLVTTGDDTVLRLHIAATGRAVDPVPSFRGVHGANHITAQDLTELVDLDRLKIVVMPRHGAGKRFGTVRAGATGRIPERRLLPGGDIDLEARSAERYVLGIDCESPALGPGEHEIYVEVKGIPRLRVDVRIHGQEGEILGIECLGGHDVRVHR